MRKKVRLKLLLSPALFIALLLNGQQNNKAIVIDSDSIDIFSYDELVYKVISSQQDQNKYLYTHYLIKKAELGNNADYLLIGEDLLQIINQNEGPSSFSNMFIELSKKNKDSLKLGEAFWQEGKSYYRERKFKKALDYYLLAYEFAENINNPELKFICNHAIGALKNRTGDY